MIYAVMVIVFLQLIILFAQYRYIRSGFSSIDRSVKGFFYRKTPDTPSDYDQVIYGIAGVFNDKLKASLKASLMGSISGVARNEAMLQRAAAGVELSNSNPAFGELFKLIPKEYQDKALDNPNLVMAALNILGKSGGAQIPAPGNGSAGATGWNTWSG